MSDSPMMPAPSMRRIRWWAAPMEWLRPEGTRNGREAYQLRFLCGAVMLALAVAAIAIPVAAVRRQWPGMVAELLFATVILVQAIAVRRGASIAVVAWTILISVGSLLLASAMLPSASQVGQLYWFLLLPLAARALAVPRHDDESGLPSRRPEILLAVAMVVAALGILLAQSQLVEPTATRTVADAVAITVDVALFLGSALGLLYVHDLSVRETAEEVRRLRELLSMCAWCRRIRDGDEWIAPEQYMGRHQRIRLTHGVCPSCFEEHLPAQ